MRILILSLFFFSTAVISRADAPFKWKNIPVFTREFHKEEGLRRIPLHINTGAIKKLKGKFVSGGVPIPRNELKSIKNLRILDDAKKEIPFQAEALAFWDPGVIKWAFVEFRLQNNKPNPVYFLEYGKKVVSTLKAAPMKLTETEENLTVDTGKLKAVISKKEGSILEKVYIDKNNDKKYSEDENVLPGPVYSFVKLKDIEGDRSGSYTSLLDKKPEIKVEHHGSEETTVLVRAWHKDEKGRKSCPFDVRLTFFKGQSFIKLYHTFIISENPAIVLFPSFGIKIPCPASDSILTGIDSEKKEIKNGEATIYQDSSESYWYPDCNQFKPFCKIISDGKVSEKGKKTDGWVQLINKKSTMTVFMNEMWQNFPKAFVVKDGFLDVEFWPEAKNEHMNLRRFDQGLRPDYTIFMETESPGIRGYNYNMRCYHKKMDMESELSCSALGVAKSHEVWLDFTKTPKKAEALKQTAENPLMPFVSPEWNSFTEVCGPFHPFDPVNFGKLEKSMEMHNKTLDKHRKEWFNWYGMWHWGDFQTDYQPKGYRYKGRRWGNFNTKYGWRNGGWCLPFGFYMQYLRTGDMDKFKTAEEVASKHMDVTSRHLRGWREYRLLPEEILKNWYGGGSRYDANGWGSNGGNSYDSQHSWVFGAALQYYLTGNHRARDVVEEYLDAVDRGSKIYRLGMKYKIHGRTEDMATGIAAVGYEIDPLNERNKKMFDFFCKHQAIGLDSIEINKSGKPYYSSNKSAVGWYYKDYKGTSLMYALSVKPDQELIKALIKGHAKTYGNQMYNSLLLYYLCWKYSGNPNFAKMAWRLLAFKGYMNKNKIEKDMVLKPQVFGYNLIMNYFGERAAYEIKEEMNPESPPPAALMHYPVGSQGPDNKPLEDMRLYEPIDIRSSCNASPWKEKPRKVEANQNFIKGPVQFDFGPISRLENNYLPCEKDFFYPATKNQKPDSETFAALPFGSIARFKDVDFAFIEPDQNDGKALIVLKKGETIRVPVNKKVKRLFLLTGTAFGSDALHNTPGANYEIIYEDEKKETGKLENMKHYQIEGLYPMMLDSRYYAGSPSSFHFGVVPLNVKNEKIKEIVFRGEQENASPVIFAITAEVMSPLKREIVLKKDFGKNKRSKEKTKYETEAPNGQYLLDMTIKFDPIGCPLDVFINGKLALNHTRPWANTTIQMPVNIKDGKLMLELLPGEIHHKAKTAKGKIELTSLALEKLPDNIFVPEMKTSPENEKELAYGWRLKGPRAALNNYFIKNFKPEHSRYIPAENMMEDDELFMTIGGVMKGEFIVDNVPPGKYKVTIFARNRRLDSRVTIQVEDQKHEDIILQSSRLPGKLVGYIEKPLVYTVDVKDGQFNMIIDIAPKDQLHYRSWSIAGLKLEKID